MKTEITVLDGATGTLLCDTSSPDAAASPLWSAAALLANPARVFAVHAQYLAAGATYISTATYQLTRRTLARAGITDDSEVNRLHAVGMHVACDAASRAPAGGKAALCIGSYGASLQPTAEYTGVYPPPCHQGGEDTVRNLKRSYKDRLRIFASQPAFQNVAALAIETVPSIRLDEVTAITSVFNSRPYRKKKTWVSVVYPDPTPPAEQTVRGIVKAVFTGIERDSGPRGVGVNCTKMHIARHVVRGYSAAVKQMRVPQHQAILVIYPDGGLTYDVDNKTWSKEQEGDVELWCAELIEIVREARDEECWGEIIVGGCCKTTPAHIRALAERVKRLE
ncbi:hypothetical protein ABW21_db0209184 [Orbilia brochopaga]|nr:hypothetical protein ABW21_db0209184 [Drechslerella brochopaga]